MRGIYTQEIRPLSKLATEKIAFPPEPDKRTDISNYRVASLLKIKEFLNKNIFRKRNLFNSKNYLKSKYINCTFFSEDLCFLLCLRKALLSSKVISHSVHVNPSTE